MPLLDASIEEVAPDPSGGSGMAQRVAYLLFPLYEAGSLWDLVTAGTAAGTPLPLREVLLIFVQAGGSYLAWLHGAAAGHGQRGLHAAGAVLSCPQRQQQWGRLARSDAS